MPDWPYIVESVDLPGIPQNTYVEPIEMTAGDTILFYRTLPLYKATAGWSLTYSMRGVPGASYDFNSAPFGDDHQMQVLPAVTALWKDGKYAVQGYANNATTGPGGTAERHVIYDGLWTVKVNLALAPADLDVRTHAKRSLDNIELVLEGRATDDILTSQIEGVQIGRLPIAELLRLRNYYRAEYKAEVAKAKIKGGRATGRTILAVFSKPQ